MNRLVNTGTIEYSNQLIKNVIAASSAVVIDPDYMDAFILYVNHFSQNGIMQIIYQKIVGSNSHMFYAFSSSSSSSANSLNQRQLIEKISFNEFESLLGSL